MPTLFAASPPNRRNRRERVGWLVVVAAMVAVLAATRMASLARIDADERERLGLQALALEQNLAQQLSGVAAALRSVREDLPDWLPAERTQRARSRMEALCAALPGLRTMTLVGADGRLLADARPEERPEAGPGDARVTAWFEALRGQPEPGRLFVSPVFRPAPDEAAVILAVVVTGPQGEFAGAVAATLDGRYFDTLLRSVLYAPDMSADVVHPDGAVLVISTATPGPRLAGQAEPIFRPEIYAEHLAAGQPASLNQRADADGQQRLVALRSLRLQALGMDRPLLLGVSRSVGAVHAAWLQQTLWTAASALLAAVGSLAVMLTLQRRRAERGAVEAARQAQAEADAERLRLALHGADLALWDLDVPSNHAVANDRWATMLGYTPGDPADLADRWTELLHPEDRDRVVAAQQAHLEGRSASFEATYRLRHRSGHWVWVLDRGRVVQRSEAGAPLRMVGTHLDISASVAADEALRRNEQSLAITLHSIGDAVIATDAQGRVTRINNTARRLTGWAAETALGQPLGEVFRIQDAETGLTVTDPVARALASGEIVGFANGTKLLARDGAEYQISDSAAPIRAEGGAIVGGVLVFSDVTEQYRMVQALRRSEQKSRALLEALHSGVVVHAPDTQVLEANAAACRILGLSLDQMRGKVAIDPAWAFLEEDGSVMAHERFPVSQVLATGEVVRNLMVGLRRPDMPHPKWALCVAFPLHDAQGVLQEIVVTFYDLTERRLAEEAERRSAARRRMAGRLARLGGWRLDRASGQVWLSSEAATLFDARAAGPLELDVAALLALVAPAQREALAQALGGETAFDIEVEASTRSGQALTVHVLGEPAHDEGGRVVTLQGAMQDVTQSRRQQQQLRLLETAVAQLNDVVLIAELTASPGAVDATPTEGHERIVFVNDAFERLTGLRREEVLGRAPAALGLAAGPTGPAAASAEPAGAAALAELLCQRRDGSAYWAEQEVVPLRAADGRTTHRVTVQRDITDRKRAETVAQAAQQDLAATLDAVPDLLFELDAAGTVFSYHSPRSDLLYVPPETFLNRRVTDFLPPAAATVIAAALSEAAAQGYSGGRQYELLLPAGSHWFELSVARKAGRPDTAQRFVALARDITERRQGEEQRRALERQLREAQKIESIGTLAGGIAHDFNNILPAILGNVALAQQDLAPGHPALASLEQIHKAAVRARTLVQQILTFSRRQPHALVVQPLQPVLEETLSLLRATLPASVRLDTAITAEPISVDADATQLQQVVMNLCTNAWHALPEGRGRIELGLELRRPGDGVALPGDTRAVRGLCAHLWVSDNGSGMAPEVLERIFDPFFTTKPVGQGTGLGLSVVHGIVQLHSGHISVHSTPGQGSSFHVLLPLALAAPAQAEVPPSADAAALAGRGERVLYVDDDEVMGLMVQRLLQRAGYIVTTCSLPAQALALLREQPAPFDLLISDYHMPEISGTALTAQLKQQHPGLPVIISSGFISDELRQQAAALGVRALLKKEQTLEALPALVRRVLSGAA